MVLRARDFLTGRVTDRGSFEKVVVLFTRAIELDANYGEAYAGLAMAQVLNYQNRWTDAANPLEEASRLAARAIATAAHSPYADRKSTRLNSSHSQQSRMPSSA